VKDEQIDDVLKSAAPAPQQVDPRVLERIRESIKPSLRPVSPLPPPWLMTLGLTAVCATISLAGAARSGFFGFAKMDLQERFLIFPVLTVLAVLAAVAFVRQMTPASRIRLSPGALLALSSLALLAVFGDVFRDHHVDHFVSAGIACLLTGLLYALPAGLLGWWLLRRGFAVKPVSAGLIAGTLAGLAGVGMLELHCPNFQAAHILVWHTAVVPVSAALGALVGWASLLRKRADNRARHSPASS
jgi:hypothetical protein